MNKFILGVFAAALLTTTSWAQVLKVGDKLPELDLTYLSEEPELEGSPAIIEFWATWCPPCRESIPHLNEIYKKFKDDGLVIIGISNEEAAEVKQFMKKTPMNYTVALDEADELAAKFGADGIPHAALVNKAGKIVWIGHPMELTEAMIDKVVE